MLHLRSSNGYANTIGVDVSSRMFANTISAFGRSAYISSKAQFTPNFNSDYGFFYEINLTNQLTGKEYFSALVETSTSKFPRYAEFILYLDDYVGSYHINVDTDGLYDYEIYVSDGGNSASKTSSTIIGIVSSGIAMVHNDNYTNDHYQNSPSGVTPLVIPETKSYNG